MLCRSKCLPSDVLDDRLLQFLLKVPEAAPSRSMCANCEEVRHATYSACLLCSCAAYNALTRLTLDVYFYARTIRKELCEELGNTMT